MRARLAQFSRALREQPKPARFVAARVLGKTGLCRLFHIPCDGYRMHFFPTAMSSALWVDPDYRHEDTSFLRAWLQPGDTVVDAGANVGFLALLAATRVGPRGAVHAVEAHPHTADCLRRNVALNALGNVHVTGAALGAAPGELVFTSSPLDDQNFVRPDTGPGIAVPVTTLDDLCADLPRVDLLKVDVEGFELPVFQGAARLLARTACVYFESWDVHCARYGTTPAEVIGVLEQAGFHVFRRDDRVLHPVLPDHASPVNENLIAVRELAALDARLGPHGFRVALPGGGLSVA